MNSYPFFAPKAMASQKIITSPTVERQSTGVSTNAHAKLATAQVPGRTANAEHVTGAAKETDKLLDLSSELRFRSNRIVGPYSTRQTKRILIWSRLDTVRCSLDALLRIRGYTTTLARSLHELRYLRQQQQYLAIVAYLEPAVRAESAFIDRLRHSTAPLPVLLVAHNLRALVPAVEVSSSLIETVSIEFLIAELDRMVGLVVEDEAAEPTHQPALDKAEKRY